MNVAKPSRQSPDFPDSFHRVVIKGLHVKDGKLLLCHDFWIPHKPPVWELPGGGLDFGETFAGALTREVKEEMNLDVTRVAPEPLYAWTAKIENLRGMDWFYSLILAFPFEVATLESFVPTIECKEMRFFSKEELLDTKEFSTQMKPLADIFNPEDFS